jgi:hypothetical protein
MDLEGVRLQLVSLSSAELVVQAVLNLEDKTRLNTIALMWSWWDGRNKANAGEKKRDTNDGTALLAGAGKLTAIQDGDGEWHSSPTSTMENGMSPVQLETDSCCLEEAIENDSIDRARGGVFYMEVRDMVNYQFDHVEILFVPRSCNTVAHDIARYGLYWDSGQFLIWTDHLLEFVIDLEFG